MKKLLFVIPTLRMGGAEKALTSLLKSLDPSSVQVSLFLFEADGPLRAQIPDWVNILPENKVTRAMTLAHYQDDPERVYGLCFGSYNVKFRAEGKKVFVLSAESITFASNAEFDT